MAATRASVIRRMALDYAERYVGEPLPQEAKRLVSEYVKGRRYDEVSPQVIGALVAPWRKPPNMVL
jgi:hypothetical protein